ncbi:MAG: DUF6491 family protein [Pseudomonadota bacterium]
MFTAPLNRLSIFLAVFILAACASTEPKPQVLDLPPETAPGEPVNSVFVGGFIRDWQAVGHDTILMEFSRQRRFLIELAPPCPSVLRSITTLRLIPGQSGYLSNFDRVQMGDISCRIESIRPLLATH